MGSTQVLWRARFSPGWVTGSFPEKETGALGNCVFFDSDPY